MRLRGDDREWVGQLANTEAESRSRLKTVILRPLDEGVGSTVVDITEDGSTVVKTVEDE